MKKNIYEKIFEKICSVCGHVYMADIYEQGKCEHCGWENGHLSNDNPDNVIIPNLISLNKARQLYKEKKPFNPEFEDFVKALAHFGETQFKYNGVYYGLIKHNNQTIEMFKFDSEDSKKFKSEDEFIANAKIGDKFLKDIWNQVEEPNYM